MVELKVPELGESIQEVQVASWFKKVGEWVDKDEDLVELESEKASQALPSPEAGIVKKISVEEGQFAQVGDLLAEIEQSEKPAGDAPPAQGAADASHGNSNGEPGAHIMPAAERMLHEHNIPAAAVVATGPGGRMLKEDVQNFIESQKSAAAVAAPAKAAPAKAAPAKAAPAKAAVTAPDLDQWNESIEGRGDSRQETVKPMSMIRRTIANRLVEAQSNAALLTTFNEIDMLPVMDLRKKYKEPFLKKHGVKLGFMSFFAKASVEALKRFPAINSEIRGRDVVSRNYYDIGIAIGGGKGLVVPVMRSVQNASFADIEKRIGQFAELAAENKIKPSDLEGGTFTISNGGVYGSLLSTPIVNPPQSGILGLHSIQERPVAIDGQVVIRPMMYVALTYDHRIVDGREAVGFLRTIKEVLEEPARLFLEV